jgi:uncharacterized membrane protein YeaQ/YmgE (transglycosylase-associated protein family)
MLVNLISWTIFGLFAGSLARLLVPGRDPMGCLTTILLGVAGSWLGGFLGYALWGHPTGQVHPAGFFGALIGSVLVLLLYRRIAAPRIP